MRHGLYLLLGLLLVPTVGLVGDVVTDGKFTSTMSTGAPLEVASDAMVPNLNADMVDGVEGTNIYTKAEVDALVTAAGTADSRRWFYLTTTVHDGVNALTACDAGFHMASIYEILDVSNLRYDTGRGGTRDDSGQGPPQGYGGWVRTGASATTTQDWSAVSNCNAWTSSDPSYYGTQVNLTPDWSVGQRFWAAITLNCDATSSVWCVQD
jgi:hypothetical protein